MGLCVILGTILLCLSSLVWGPFVLSLVFGEKMLAYSYLLIPTLLASGFMLGCGVLGSVLISMQKRTECFISTIVAVLTILLSCQTMVRMFYMNGAIYSLILAHAANGIVTLGFILYHLRNNVNITDNVKV